MRTAIWHTCLGVAIFVFTAFSALAEVTWNFRNVHPVDSPNGLAMQNFANNVATATKGRVKAMLSQCALQRIGQLSLRIERAACVERIDALLFCIFVLSHNQLQPIFLHRLIAVVEQRLKVPSAGHVQHRERRRRGVKRLARQVEHDGRILAHRIEHDRVFSLGHDFAEDVDAFGFEPLEMGKHCHAGAASRCAGQCKSLAA